MRLKTAYGHAKDQLNMAAKRRNQQVTPNVTVILLSGTLVLKKNHPLGRHEIHDNFGSTIFEIVNC